jgi:ribosomal protein L37AE/L43A
MQKERVSNSHRDIGTDMICPRCGCRAPKTLVHGHYQCDNCKCVADGDCCQGEMATEPRTMELN